MSIRNAIALGLLATTAAFALPATSTEASAKDPASGKNCVNFFSAERTNTGQTRMNYRNICANSFVIRIQGNERSREKTIEAGSPDKPSMAYISCKDSDRCENARWVYE